jgi:hypothetical protein
MVRIKSTDITGISAIMMILFRASSSVAAFKANCASIFVVAGSIAM